MPPRFNNALRRALHQLTGPGCPPRLAQTIRYAVGGRAHRLRPRLCYAVAEATGADPTPITDRVATALEFLHTASLIQDDLPAFDDAATRRGRPAVHRRFSEALAVLAADALIVGAFDQIAAAGVHDPDRAIVLIRLMTQAVAPPTGAVAGQAWEAEALASVERYHRGKTAALFEASAMAGAASVNHPHEVWGPVGYHIGMAYQLADDVRDAEEETHAEPTASLRLSAAAAWSPAERDVRLAGHRAAAIAAVPECRGRGPMQRSIGRLMRGFGPAEPATELTGSVVPPASSGS